MTTNEEGVAAIVDHFLMLKCMKEYKYMDEARASGGVSFCAYVCSSIEGPFACHVSSMQHPASWLRLRIGNKTPTAMGVIKPENPA
ncbi:hypothetical protein [Shewanella sp. FJAT-52076]|uniref:hypothetical protein n=1 Tax=Shewanella sp. FJAT-52076 TaxID=2864202 RepID=UPI001C657940|nr:hypothetical protein [Shewanella sp. FJAT-52076]QYJ76984.1 hypothetical protein K0H79_08570 [Shewanella sp. FJAT-52076]